MKILLDTNAFLWSISGDPFLSSRARQVIADPQAELLLSAASAFEIATKVRIGKLRLSEPLETFVPGEMAAARITSLPVLMTHALRSGALPLHHRDPFDRLLLAQAQVERIPIVTSDRQFAKYDVEIIW